MNQIIILTLLMTVLSCASTSSEGEMNEKETQTNDWCKYLAYGTFEGETNDGLKVHVKCEQINEHPYYVESDGFFISIELPSGKEIILEGGSKFSDFFELSRSTKNIKLNEPIKFEPDAVELNGDYLYDSDFELDQLNLTYVSEVKLKLVFPKAQEVIQKLTSSKISEEINSIVLTKTDGLNECFNFDPKASFNSFSDHEKGFIEHDLEMAENWKLADKELMLDFLLRKPEIESKAWGGWNKSLEGIGSVFKLDLNGDNEQDICGYFSHEHMKDKKLLFKIFLNNGVSYDEVYSKNMSNYWGGDEVFFPDELNGKPVVGCSFLDKGGYCLYFNKLTGKIEKKFYD